MDTVSYEEVEWIFSHVWSGWYEDCFYEWAWEALEKQGLTEYDDEESFIDVFMRAGALFTIVGEFSQEAFEENFWYDSLSDVLARTEDCYKEVGYENFWYLVGQLYRKRSGQEEISYDISDPAMEFILSQKKNVISALESSTHLELSVILYAVVKINSYLSEEGDVYINDLGEEEEVTEDEYIESYEDFWKMLKKYELEMMGSMDGSLTRGYIANSAPERPAQRSLTAALRSRTAGF